MFVNASSTVDAALKALCGVDGHTNGSGNTSRAKTTLYFNASTGETALEATISQAVKMVRAGLKPSHSVIR